MPDKRDGGMAPESPMERFLRFGTALFAVKKDELPKRERPERKPRKKPKPAPGA